MSVKLFACGDVVNSTANPDFIDPSLKYIIQSCDISIANFEAPVKIENMRPIPKVGPHLYQPKESIYYLKEAGFTMVSLANNHIYDYGQLALEKTIEELCKREIQFVGAGLTFEEAYTPKIIEKNGIKLGIIAACENEFGCLYEDQNRGGYAWLLNRNIEDNIRKLKNEVDYIIVIAHAGVEDISIPIKEWRDLYRRFCDIGVDVVIGHHPHVPQGYERYNNSLIFYSLGNFYFDTPSFRNSPDDSYSVIIEFNQSRKIQYNIIYHKKINGKVLLVDEEKVSFNIEELNNLLMVDYERRNNEICLELFHKYYYGYYKTAIRFSPITLIKKLLFIKRDSFYNHLFLLHNIKIDSHRFVVQRALSLLTEAP
jgi:poly-gamma-glutamate synthesis protein (capsule biosynthesis protein)